MLCSMLLVTLPAIAAEQTTQKVSASTSEITTASEDDYVLDIYGNANEDDTIDMRDLTYVKLIFFGKKPATELADAKYDGKINPLDFIQIKLIIVGKEKEITIVDQADRTVTVKKPVETIAAGDPATSETLRTLKAQDRIVGVSTYESKKKEFFPELCKLPVITTATGHYDLDYEKVYELSPDIFITYAPGSSKYAVQFEEIVNKLDLAGIKVLGFTFYNPAKQLKNTEKLGYILDRKDEADEFIDWHERHMNTINERVEEISEADKPRVYWEHYKDYFTFTKAAMYNQYIVDAGGINIAADLPGTWIDVDREWVMEQNPDIIVRTVWIPASGYSVDDPSEMKALWESIMDRPELANTPAVKNKRVYIVTYGTVAGTAHIFVGREYLAKWFHPRLFADVDPKTIHQEYLTEFQGLDYDLDEHGVFVYPEPS